MNQVLFNLSTIILLISLGTLAHSETIEFDCQGSFSRARTMCRIAAEPVLAENLDLEMEATYDYSFKCKGRAPSVALVSDLQNVNLNFQNDPRHLGIKASKYIKVVDLSPRKTLEAHLEGECKISLKLVTMQPTNDQISKWQNEIRDQLDRLGLSLDIQRLFDQNKELLNWDKDQLAEFRVSLLEKLELVSGIELDGLIYPQSYRDIGKRGRLKQNAEMPSEWHEQLDDRPELAEIAFMLFQVEAVIDGRPCPEDGGERIGSILNIETERALALLDKVEKWRHNLRQEAKSAITRLKSVLHRVR